VNVVQESETDSSEFSKTLQQVEAVIAECESLCIRAVNRIPAENDLMISTEVSSFSTKCTSIEPK